MVRLLWLAASFAASPSWNGSTVQLLKELDQHGIRYPPTATRRELEALWEGNCKRDENAMLKQAQSTTNARIDDDSVSPNRNEPSMDEITRRHHRRRRRRQQRQHQFPDMIVAPSIPFALKNTASSLIDTGYRKVRRVKRDLVDAWMETEDGVRTVPYQYVERYQDALDTPTRQRKRRKPDSTNAFKRRTRSPRPSRRRPQATPSPQPLLLPPASGTNNNAGNSPERPPSRNRNRPPKQRRIYSPYETTESRDLLDDIGSFFVEAADRTMLHTDTNHDANHRSKKNWRDQWEERLDSMLGIHNDDEPYSRWADGTQDTEEPIISPRRRKPYPQTPLWGGGSIVSLIFSNREPRYTSLDNVDILWESSGSVLTILRWSLRRIARYYGNICRWATVYQTIPQPAVVTLVTGILLSTAKRRMLAAGMALLITRAIGEAVRESTFRDSPKTERDDSTLNVAEDESSMGDGD